jgi:hypothetical protein
MRCIIFLLFLYFFFIVNTSNPKNDESSIQNYVEQFEYLESNDVLSITTRSSNQLTTMKIDTSKLLIKWVLRRFVVNMSYISISRLWLKQ